MNIILKYIDFETSYDNFHAHRSSLFRINRTLVRGGERQQSNTMTTYGLGPALQENIPEVKCYIRTHDGNSVVSVQSSSGQLKAFHENNILIVDSTFLEAFTFKFLAGNKHSPLDDPNSIVMTRSMATKYFGGADAIGRDVKLNGGRMNGDYIVSAIIEDVPGNSHFSFGFLLPIHNIFLQGQYKEQDGWGTNNFTTYVQLHDQSALANASARLPAIAERYLNPRLVSSGGVSEIRFQPLRDIHLETGIRHDVPTVSPDMLFFFGLIAAFILMIAWINYVNLSTARAMERAREVGIMKAVGARRSALVLQFLLESVIVNLFAVVMAVTFTLLFIPRIGTVLGKDLRAQDLRAATEAIGNLYQQLIPGEPYEYYFLDEAFNAQYRSDMQFGQIFGLFAALAIAISCLGLWGLASFTTAQRLKEIGVRKVLGASVLNIVFMLCSQFMKLVCVASVITLPLAWYGMDTWLGQFAFRIDIGWPLFVPPFAALAFIALLTVGVQVMKGATANPADVLRAE